MNTKMIVRFGVLLALALIIGYAETWLTLPLLFPGAKLGLANIVSLLVLAYFGRKYFVLFDLLRVVLSALLFTGFGLNFFISLGGAVLAIIATLLVASFTKASIFGISVAGAVMHGLGQVIVVSFAYQTALLMNYALALTILGIVTGIIVAWLASLILKRLPEGKFSS